eukprot:3092253-Lingulodinium_polyedra.AAC.1
MFNSSEFGRAKVDEFRKERMAGIERPKAEVMELLESVAVPRAEKPPTAQWCKMVTYCREQLKHCGLAFYDGEVA